MSRWSKYYIGDLIGQPKDYPTYRKIRRKIRKKKKNKAFATVDVEYLLTVNCFRLNAFASTVVVSDMAWMRIARFIYRKKNLVVKENAGIPIAHYCNFFQLSCPLVGLSAHINENTLCLISPISVVIASDFDS